MPIPKRSVTSDFLTPSRMPSDSAMRNATADETGEYSRYVRRELEELRKQLVNLKFTHDRETGYQNLQQNQDLVEDMTAINRDQDYIQKYGYVKGPDLSLQGSGSKWDGGTFAGNEDTGAKQEAEAFEAALEALVAAEGESPAGLAQILDELFDQHPVLRSLDRREMSTHPAARLAALYANSLNVSSLNRGTKKKPIDEKTFY